MRMGSTNTIMSELDEQGNGASGSYRRAHDVLEAYNDLASGVYQDMLGALMLAYTAGRNDQKFMDAEIVR